MYGIFLWVSGPNHDWMWGTAVCQGKWRRQDTSNKTWCINHIVLLLVTDKVRQSKQDEGETTQAYSMEFWSESVGDISSWGGRVGALSTSSGSDNTTGDTAYIVGGTCTTGVLVVPMQDQAEWVAQYQYLCVLYQLVIEESWPWALMKHLQVQV